MGEVYSIRPSVSLEEEYDSNPRLSSNDEDVDEDYITSVMPRIEIGRSNGGLELKGVYQLVDRHYSYNPELDYVGHIASLMLAGNISPKTKLTVSDFFALTKDPLETTESRESVGILIRRTGIMSNNASIGLNQDISPLFSIGINYSDIIYRFDDRNLVDSRTDSLSLGSRWTQTRNRVIAGKYEYTYYSYENGENNDFDEHSLTLGIEQRLSQNISLNMSAGAAYVQDIDDKFISTGQASLIKSSNGSSTQIAYSRSATTSFGLTNEITINDTASARYEQSLGKSFKVSLSGSYSQNKSEPTARLDVEYLDAGINGEWTPKKWLKVGIGYSHYNQWGESPSDGDVERDQVFVSLTAITEEWRF